MLRKLVMFTMRALNLVKVLDVEFFFGCEVSMTKQDPYTVFSPGVVSPTTSEKCQQAFLIEESDIFRNEFLCYRIYAPNIDAGRGASSP